MTPLHEILKTSKPSTSQFHGFGTDSVGDTETCEMTATLAGLNIWA
jgi:hypothetical protein